MKKIIYTLSIFMLVAFSNTLISCSDDTDLPNSETAAKATKDLNKQSGVSAPVTTAAAPLASHKLIFINNTSTTLYINQIFASEGPSRNIMIVGNKAAPGIPITWGPMSTITYTNVVNTSPSANSISNWYVFNGSTSVLHPASYVLSTYGIQLQNAVVGAKYTYWTYATILDGFATVHYSVGRDFPGTLTTSTGAVVTSSMQNGDCVITAN